MAVKAVPTKGNLMNAKKSLALAKTAMSSSTESAISSSER